MQTKRTASREHWWGSAATGRPLSTTWLFAFLVWAHLSDVLFANRWAAFASGLGLLTAVLVWSQRGQLLSPRWCVCLWGAFEGMQVFVCQGLFNWYPVKGEFGQCSAYASLPFYGVGLGSAAFLAGWLKGKIEHGHRP
jgi:hypothetical protein